MSLFLRRKKRILLSRLVKAFPSEYRDDVIHICNKLTFISFCRDSMVVSEAYTEWVLLSGETIEIPYRIYLRDDLAAFEMLMTPTQKYIYHCIFSRSCDGYVREKHIKALLESQAPLWTMPYIIKVCDEYVVEILSTVYDSLREQDCEKYRELCLLNLDYFKRGHSRMISYWNEYYSGEVYSYNNYIGKKLYSECFGYSKSGQKTIKIKRKD